MDKIITTHWYPENKLIITHISGEANSDDIKRWEQSLLRTLDQVEDNDTFKIFVNLHGFKAINIEAHKQFRTIIPLTLATYGWKCGYVDMFEEASLLQLTNIRGIQCTAAAHAHHDETKMALYESNYSRSNEHFFTDPIAAQQWISNMQ